MYMDFWSWEHHCHVSPTSDRYVHGPLELRASLSRCHLPRTDMYMDFWSWEHHCHGVTYLGQICTWTSGVESITVTVSPTSDRYVHGPLELRASLSRCHLPRTDMYMDFWSWEHHCHGVTYLGQICTWTSGVESITVTVSPTSDRYVHGLLELRASLSRCHLPRTDMYMDFWSWEHHCHGVTYLGQICTWTSGVESITVTVSPTSDRYVHGLLELRASLSRCHLPRTDMYMDLWSWEHHCHGVTYLGQICTWTSGVESITVTVSPTSDRYVHVHGPLELRASLSRCHLPRTDLYMYMDFWSWEHHCHGVTYLGQICTWTSRVESITVTVSPTSDRYVHVHGLLELRASLSRCHLPRTDMYMDSWSWEHHCHGVTYLGQICTWTSGVESITVTVSPTSDRYVHGPLELRASLSRCHLPRTDMYMDFRNWEHHCHGVTYLGQICTCTWTSGVKSITVTVSPTSDRYVHVHGRLELRASLSRCQLPRTDMYMDFWSWEHHCHGVTYLGQICTWTSGVESITVTVSPTSDRYVHGPLELRA